ncbi:ATP-binding cassette domain-containing protein [Paenibacillus sp. SAF-054]|uniref:ATP-binding cassette domain-containing protein n=1 Tax=unclassified Paenibacillus TaxID=185978 RepID=UPI003F8167EF
MAYELNRVHVNFDGRQVLKDISCRIEEGKWISIIGPSGAGKSTFAKALKGLIPDATGEFRENGQPVSRDGKGRIKVRQDVGFVFQYPEHQIFETSVYRELAFALKIRGLPADEIRKAIKDILPRVGLEAGILDSAPFQLSGGQKRRVAIAAVLLTEPRMLIMDEPTAGLDPWSRTELLNMLKAWQIKNRTVLFISHQMDDVAEYSDEVMVFHQGRLLAHDDVIATFLGPDGSLQEAGLPLPEPVQALRFMEELSGVPIAVKSVRERDLFEGVRSLLESRSLAYER